jgi:hypothetical protein
MKGDREAVPFSNGSRTNKESRGSPMKKGVMGYAFPITATATVMAGAEACPWEAQEEPPGVSVWEMSDRHAGHTR